jgi:predicted transcriptional regulator YdeE
MDISEHDSEIARFPVKQYFNYEKNDRDDDFDFFAGWAIDEGMKTPEDMKLKLKEIELRLGTTYLDEDRITRIKNYLVSQAKLKDAIKNVMSQERIDGN